MAKKKDLEKKKKKSKKKATKRIISSVVLPQYVQSINQSDQSANQVKKGR